MTPVTSVAHRVERVERRHPERLLGRRVRRALAAERARDVRGDDPAGLVAGRGEVLLGHQRDVALGTPFGPHPAVERPVGVVDEVGLRLGDTVVAAGQPAAGDKDRVPRRGRPHLVRARVAPAPARRVAGQAAAPADPREPVRVDVDVVRVVGRAVVAAEIDRLGEDLGCAGSLRSVTQIGRPSPRAPGVNGPR